MDSLPPVGYYFKVELLAEPYAAGLDLRFQKVSGLNVAMTPKEVHEGGQNLYAHRLPEPYKYGNLVLERGLTNRSLFNDLFQAALNTFRFNPGGILVTLLDESDNPSAGWLFLNAYPVRWSSSDLDANANKIMIDTMELAYTHFTRMIL